MSSNIKIPNGSEEFFKALEVLRNRPENCNNTVDLVNQCCKLCSRKGCECEDCYVQAVGDLFDPYRKKIQEKSQTGMYTSDIYRGKDGKYYYSHPQGSG